MTYFSYINDNLESVKREIRMGLISCAILKHYSIYSRYDYYNKINYNRRDAIIYTSLDFNVSEQWIYKIIQNMEREV
jgi:hypothetical protein